MQIPSREDCGEDKALVYKKPSICRAQLLSSVIFGMYNFWASIFILSQEVIDQVNQLCRNYLWGGAAEFKRPPFISWNTAYTPKKYGGIGLKNLAAWNQASIAKLVWMVALKKDIMWVKWVHGKYLKLKDWWDYQPPPDCSWYWKKLVANKELFKQVITQGRTWAWQGANSYSIQRG